MTIAGFKIQFDDACRWASSMHDGDLDRKQMFVQRCLMVGGSENCKIVAPSLKKLGHPCVGWKEVNVILDQIKNLVDDCLEVHSLLASGSLRC
jgi:hypothetical protein